MRKVVILTLVTLFTCVEYSQAQTTEKEMTRQEKKAAQEALDKMLFQEAKEAIDNQTFVLEADRVYFTCIATHRSIITKCVYEIF